MRAQAGDRIVVLSPITGGTVRDGEIVEVRGSEGAPPYLVRWADTDTTGLFFPGSDAHVTAGHDRTAAEQVDVASAARSRSWRVEIDVLESGDETMAHAVLVAEAPRGLDAKGEAHRNPADAAVPKIGDEVAVARALRQLSDRLFEAASADITAVEGQQADVSR
jgi:hypothetical protein